MENGTKIQCGIRRSIAGIYSLVVIARHLLRAIRDKNLPLKYKLIL